MTCSVKLKLMLYFMIRMLAQNESSKIIRGKQLVEFSINLRKKVHLTLIWNLRCSSFLYISKDRHYWTEAEKNNNNVTHATRKISLTLSTFHSSRREKKKSSLICKCLLRIFAPQLELICIHRNCCAKKVTLRIASGSKCYN